MMAHAFNRLWYELPKMLALPLLPFAWVYQAVTTFRNWYLTRFKVVKVNVPLIVVGNLTVGGAGKTPLVISLVNHLKSKDVKVGIVSRGYGARVKHFPHEIRTFDTAVDVGDEPRLLANKTGVPVVIAPKRNEAVAHLLTQHQVDVIISDDGLQHAKMGRSIEIVVLDGARGFGNGYCLPAGPLRESKARLEHVDMVVTNGGDSANAYRMDIEPEAFYPSALPKTKTIAAIAGIGHPKRFFDTLESLRIEYKPYVFKDHHQFTAKDLSVRETVIVMTEKDAVKCHDFKDKPIYVLPVSAKLESAFWKQFDNLLDEYERI